MFAPLHLHVFINRLPELGLGIGLLALILGFLFRSRDARRVALILIFICAASVWFVVWTGQKGYNAIYYSLEPTDQAWLEAHMNVAEQWSWSFYLLAASALAAILCPLRWLRSEIPLAVWVLLFGTGLVAVACYISYLGGQIRHVEFRESGPPLVRPTP